METTHLAMNPSTSDLTELDDNTIEAYFADLGVTVSVVAHCDDASCPACFPLIQRAQAA